MTAANTYGASNITTVQALMNGGLTPAGATGNYWWQVATAAQGIGNGSNTVVQAFGTGAGAVAAEAGPLLPNTPYVCQLVAQLNYVPYTLYYGGVQSFTTLPENTCATSGASSVTTTSATLNGSIMPSGGSGSWCFAYGTVAGGINQQTATYNYGGPGGSIGASVGISGLTPGTAYQYQLVSFNADGTTSYGGVVQFTTTALVVNATCTTGAASSVAQTTATLNGTITPNGNSGSYYFTYGPPGNPTQFSTGQVGFSSGTGGVSASITGLSPSTSYQFQLVLTNGAVGGVGSFTTQATLPSQFPPSAETSSASGITANGATLNGSVMPNGYDTTTYFQYGLNTNYGSNTSNVDSGSGTIWTPMSAAITGLTQNTLYHYRAVAVNSYGTAYGPDQTFSTSPTPVPFAPTLTSPPSNSYDDASTGQVYVGIYNPNIADNLVAYALRQSTDGGAYQYWRASDSSLQSTVQWNPLVIPPGASITVTVPNTLVANGHVYTWSIATQDAQGNGPFAADFKYFSEAAQPVILTAPTGTLTNVPEPTVTWTVALAPGTVQTAYRIVVESGSYGTVPGSGTPVWDSGVVASASTSVVIGVAAVGYCRVFLQVTQTGGLALPWTSIDFDSVLVIPPTPSFISATAINDPQTALPAAQLVISCSDTYFTGLCSLIILRSDGLYVRGAGWPVGTSIPIPSGGAVITVNDYEATPGTAYTYTAQVITTPPYVSAWSAVSAMVTPSTQNQWFVFDPLSPGGAANFQTEGDPKFSDHEASSMFEAFGRPFMLKSTAGMFGRQASIVAAVTTQADYQTLRSALLNTGILCIVGPLEFYYATVSSDRSGNLKAGTAALPGNYWDSITFTAAEQGRP